MADEKKILLHVCCAPCSCSIITRLLEENYHPTVFFYNPNIHPQEEYLRRKDAVIAYLTKKNVPFIEGDYNRDIWYSRIKGLEEEPERGKRCSACFDLRLEITAFFAHERGFTLFATTNGIGRWKDRHQVERSGIHAAARYPNLTYLARNWREKGGLEQSARISKEERFYIQNYCGCEFSKEKRGKTKAPSAPIGS